MLVTISGLAIDRFVVAYNEKRNDSYEDRHNKDKECEVLGLRIAYMLIEKRTVEVEIR